MIYLILVIWEIRHGSIMALREILSYQAASAGVFLPDLNTKGAWYTDLEEGKKNNPLKREREIEIDLNVGLNLEDYMSEAKRIKIEHHSAEFLTEIDPEKELKPGILVKQENGTWNSNTADTPCEINLVSAKPELDLNEDVGPASASEREGISLQKHKNMHIDSGFISKLPEDSRALKMLRLAQHVSAKNWEFLQDCAIRFLCVLSLDRFGDYVADQVVAPVRETCAQALGAVLKHMHPSMVYGTLNTLLQMQHRQEWEVRHGSLLGIKYLVAIRQEMLQELLSGVLPAIDVGLEDRDDDVRAVAAEALTPAASAIVSFAGQTVNRILMQLWDILLDLDDLSPSTSSVMHLLAELYSQPEVVPKTLEALLPVQRQIFDLNEAVGVDDHADSTMADDNPYLLSSLAPRLWPFMRHSISSVRHAAIRTLERLLEAGSKGNSPTCRMQNFWPIPILGDALRIVFQNMLLESNEAIVKCSEKVWRLLLQCPHEELAAAADCYFASWLKLSTTPSGCLLDASKMFSPTSLPRRSQFKAAAKLRASKGESLNLGHVAITTEKELPTHDKSLDISSNFTKIYVGADGEQSVTCMRVVTASALGVLAANLPEALFQKLVDSLLEHLASLSAVQRQVASVVLVSWFKELGVCTSKERMACAVNAVNSIRQRLLDLLDGGDSFMPTCDLSLPYAELSRTYSKMRSEAAALIRIASTSGFFQNIFSTGIPPADELSIDAAVDLATKVLVSKDAFSEDGREKQAFESLEAARQRLLATAGYLKCVQGNLHISVTALMSGAVVWMVELPAKLNPVIKPLMSALKREQEEVLQRMAAEAVAEIISQCVGRRPSPNDKLIKNICALTCTDPSETPQATQMNANELNLEEDSVLMGKGAGNQHSKSQTSSVGEERSRAEGFISRRGAEIALKSLCDKFQNSLFERLPRLWECLTEVFKPSVPDGLELLEALQNMQMMEFNEEPQVLINNLQVLRSIAPLLVQPLQFKLLTLLPGIFGCVRHWHVAVRLVASRCITSMAKTLLVNVMGAVMEKAIPMLRDSSSVQARQGAGMLITLLVEDLGVKLVAYAPLLVVPLLGCMSDSDPNVRQSVTRSFAALVPLLPLARGVPSPTGLSQKLSSRTAEDAHFLEQLLDNSQVDDYKLAVELKVTLRRYQQEGINWLGFLKRFKLHGILCDDMGLGKTLQASAIVASDFVERVASKVDKDQLHSLIVCPSTLVGHWAFEIEKFIDTSVLNPLQYVGSPQERSLLRNQFTEYNTVITSYDVVRKDIDFLGSLVWNYCILDEGHIIKNARSKITTAVKQLKAEHRLILSGTPIQNNVLELWSLFDFLMPGFLGAERQFQSTYGKPILAARDVKRSAKDAEAGALAMEALHKQVMPFLLRRTKDEVLADLPEKIIQDRYCDLSPVQLRLYEHFSRSEAKKEISTLVEAYGSSGADDEPTTTSKASSHVFQALQYLLKLCSHPLLVIGDAPSDSLVSKLSECIPDSKDIRTSLHDLQHAPKLVALQEILEECGIGTENGIGMESSGSEDAAVAEGSQHRVLIFAQHKAFLDIIEKDLFQTRMKSVTYMRLDGSVEPSKRFDIVKTFNSDPTIDVLLLTTHVGGLGLNLTSADTVVFVEHDWNPMRDHQAMDRAHRLGQRKVVNVHRLIMRGTLEEKVMSLQKFKVSVANAVINAENASLNSMDTTQLLDLFTTSALSGKVASSSKNLENDETSNNVNAIGAGKGLKSVLNGLDVLWDQSQYTEEYNVGQFVARLNS
ncbi:TATA-binding protein-associated factor BTAF1 isoform X2 [Cryptomeria japonica]|uniref:TATA-binding protein-associated factor BTAF1 isoform X2 n=1 Tax=Cryptomeria japonica TaxID=3369 RepID=UPI0027DA994A|nr:TATA-binding protein-associated factor BTAF1 isoform X2 [Cryptomeria japonica]